MFHGELRGARDSLRRIGSIDQRAGLRTAANLVKWDRAPRSMNVKRQPRILRDRLTIDQTVANSIVLPDDKDAPNCRGAVLLDANNEEHCSRRQELIQSTIRRPITITRIGATGFEPAIEIAGTEHGDCGYENCDMCRAANALHSGRLGWLAMASTDSDLQRVITAWVDLPDPIRRAIMALVASQ